MEHAREPIERRIQANGIELAYFEWVPERRGRNPSLLFAHATGFHARCWDSVVANLGDQHVIALDQRSHGRSTVTEITHWKIFGEDLAAFIRALELTNLVGVGHSMGGHAMTDAAATLPDRFQRLVLIDPVITSPKGYGESGWDMSEMPDGVHPTARRKRHFVSVDAMFQRFESRTPYDVFDKAALRDYCSHGLLPNPAGKGFVLACPPEIEASIYLTNRTNPGVLDSARAIEMPVLILRARRPSSDSGNMDFSSSPTWPGLVHMFRNAKELHFANRTHFLPMEDPSGIAALILQGTTPDV